MSYDVSVTIDTLILGFDRALRTLSGAAKSTRPNPAGSVPDAPLTPKERRHATAVGRRGRGLRFHQPANCHTVAGTLHGAGDRK